MNIYLTDLHGITFVDPTLDEIRAHIESLVDSDLFDFPEIILSNQEGTSLLISNGYKVVYEQDEEEIGILQDIVIEHVMALCKALIDKDEGFLEEQVWRDLD